MNTYDIGDDVRLSVAFRVSNVLTDPTTVICKVKDPNNIVTTYTYGVGSDIVHSSTGNYYVDHPVTIRGTHFVRWEGTGTANGAEESTFFVRESNFS